MRRTSATGEPFTVEFLGYDPDLRALSSCPTSRRWSGSASASSLRIVDRPSTRTGCARFDFDITTDRLGAERCRPATSSANSGARRPPTGRARATSPASRIPAIDALIEKVIFAKDRDELVAATKALDRVLLAHDYVVPQWTSLHHAHGALEPLRAARRRCPRYGGAAFPTIWWYDAADWPRRPEHRDERRDPARGAARRRALPRRPVGASLRTSTAEGEAETHGLSSFGDLALTPDFQHFAYVNPAAPKGGILSLQIKHTIGNQNFDTFNTLNIFTFKGDGAAGMDATFDSLMAPSLRRAGCASTAWSPERSRVSADKLTYRFLLRPEARFHDGLAADGKGRRLLAEDPEEQGPPDLPRDPHRARRRRGGGRRHRRGDAFAGAQPRPASRSSSALPIFSEAYWRDRDFEASTLEPPLGSGPYKVGRFEQGRFIEFERVPDYWGQDLPVNVGQNNFDRLRYEYFRDRQVAFEAFKTGVDQLTTRSTPPATGRPATTSRPCARAG